MTSPKVRRIIAAAIAAVVTSGLLTTDASAVTTWHTGSGRPALTISGSRQYIAWTGTSGTATAKELNLGWSSNNYVDIVKVSNAERIPQNVGAAILGNDTGVYMVWPSGTNGNTLTALYYNGSAATCRTTFTGLTSSHSPALAVDAAGVRYLAWTDPANHLEVAKLDVSGCAAGRPMALSQRTVVTDTAVGGPSLAFDTGSGQLGVVIAWVSGGKANTASYVGTPTLANRSVASGSSVVADEVGLSDNQSDLYLWFRDTSGALWLAFSEGCRPGCWNPSQWLPAGSAASGIGTTSQGDTWWSYFDPSGHLNAGHLFG